MTTTSIGLLAGTIALCWSMAVLLTGFWSLKRTWGQRVGRTYRSAQQARADRCVANYLQDIGWKLTDNAEREIERRSSSMRHGTRGLQLSGEHVSMSSAFCPRMR
jgi:hypothetical protein